MMLMTGGKYLVLSSGRESASSTCTTPKWVMPMAPPKARWATKELTDEILNRLGRQLPFYSELVGKFPHRNHGMFVAISVAIEAVEKFRSRLSLSRQRVHQTSIGWSSLTGN